MKKTISFLVAVAFTAVSGLVVAQTAPAQSLVPSVQATPDAPKAQSKTKSKKAKGKTSKKAKAR
ncbi:MAG: hypothetical protein ACKVQK_13725 [Burkholderiales bacterium]